MYKKATVQLPNYDAAILQIALGMPHHLKGPSLRKEFKRLTQTHIGASYSGFFRLEDESQVVELESSEDLGTIDFRIDTKVLADLKQDHSHAHNGQVGVQKFPGCSDSEYTCYFLLSDNHIFIASGLAHIPDASLKEKFSQLLDKYFGEFDPPKIAPASALSPNDDSPPTGSVQDIATLQAVIEASTDSIYAINTNYEVIIINDKGKHDFYHYDDEHWTVETGTHLKELLPEKIFSKWNEDIFSKVFAGKNIKHENSFEFDGETVWVKNNYSPIYNRAKEIIGCLEISRNITHERKAETALLKQKDLVKTILNSLPNPILVSDRNNNIIEYNEKGAFYYQRAYKQKVKLGGEFIPRHLNKVDAIAEVEMMQHVLNGEDNVRTIEFKTPNKNAYVELSILPLKEQSGKVSGLIATSLDVTDLINKEKTILQTQAVYRAVIENSFDGVDIIEVAENKEPILFARNDVMKRFFKSDTNPYLGIEHFMTIVPEIQPDGSDSRAKAISNTKNIITDRYSKDVWTFEIDGEKSIVETRVQIILVNGKNILIRNYHDITEVVEQEKEIKERKAIYKAVIDSSTDGIDVIDLNPELDNGLVIRNERMSKFVGSSTASMDFAEISKIFAKEQPDGIDPFKRYTDLEKKLNRTGKANTILRVEAQGETHDLEVFAQLVNVNDKKILVRHCHDITEQRIQDDIILDQMNKLNTQNSELQKYIESNLQLENFAYIASHDLKAPLRTVSSFAHLLKTKSYEALDPKAQHYLDIIVQSSANMQLLIDDLLTFSRVNTRKISLSDIQYDNFIKRIILELDDSIKKSNTKIKTVGALKEFQADEVKMVQLFENLINNAIKFVEKDKAPLIEIGADEDEDFWKFYIKDNGIGIKKEHQKKIFGIFEKLHSNDIFPGTGLGLTICHKIVSQHEGDISVESDEGVGTTFWFTVKKELISIIPN